MEIVVRWFLSSCFGSLMMPMFAGGELFHGGNAGVEAADATVVHLPLAWRPWQPWDTPRTNLMGLLVSMDVSMGVSEDVGWYHYCLFSILSLVLRKGSWPSTSC